MSIIRKVQITAFGDESKLRIVEVDLPDPRPREVQLAVDYSIVSGSDVNMRRGTYPFQKKAPLTPGYTVLGRVLRNGKGSSALQLGEQVVCLSRYEGQAQRINLPERFLVRVPEGVNPKAAVALPLDWVTAYQMLHRAAKVKSGQTIFIHGLSGGVGSALLQLAKLHGLEVFGTASASKHDELSHRGATAFDYKSTGWISAMQQRGGMDAVFDPLGYESFDQSFSILKPGGILVAFGMNLPAVTHTPRRSAIPVILKLLARNLLFWTRKRTTFFGLTRISRHYKPDLEHRLTLPHSGRIFVPIKATFQLDQIQQAHREYASSAGSGSIILEVKQ